MPASRAGNDSLEKSDEYPASRYYWLSDCEPLYGDAEKGRPIIVLSPPEELRTQDIIKVVACSTHPRKKDVPRFPVPSRDECVETGLPQKCWALPRWHLNINRFRLTDLKGNCPLPLFIQIFEAVLNQIESEG